MKRWHRDLLRTFERIATMLERIAVEMERYNARQAEERDTEEDDNR